MLRFPAFVALRMNRLRIFAPPMLISSTPLLSSSAVTIAG